MVDIKNEKRIGNPNTGSENIQSGYRDRIWHRKMCYTDNEKRTKTNGWRNKAAKSRKIRMLGEKETYKYLGILEADTIEQAQMNEKNFKRLSQEN